MSILEQQSLVERYGVLRRAPLRQQMRQYYPEALRCLDRDTLSLALLASSVLIERSRELIEESAIRVSSSRTRLAELEERLPENLRLTARLMV